MRPYRRLRITQHPHPQLVSMWGVRRERQRDRRGSEWTLMLGNRWRVNINTLRSYKPRGALS